MPHCKASNTKTYAARHNKGRCFPLGESAAIHRCPFAIIPADDCARTFRRGRIRLAEHAWRCTGSERSGSDASLLRPRASPTRTAGSFRRLAFPGPCSGTVAPPLRVKPPAAERRFFRDPWPEPSANAKARFRGPTSCRCWRPGSELNRRTRICSPLHNHSATRPVDCAETGAKRAAFQAPDKVKPRCRGFVFASSGSPGGNNLERETRLELATPTLARSCSTN